MCASRTGGWARSSDSRQLTRALALGEHRLCKMHLLASLSISCWRRQMAQATTFVVVLKRDRERVRDR